MTRLVVLLRGINLASRNRVAMADLRAMLEDMGYEDVRTLLQSGNAVLSSADSANAVEKAVAGRFRERFGFDADVMVRTREAIAAVVAADPLGDVADDGKRYFVSFLAGEPKKLDIDPEDYAPERFAVIGREVYIWCPEGLRECGLVRALAEKKLGVRATVRNWNTVTKLHELLTT